MDDSENLRDANKLESILGPHLHMLLHGHTHEGRLARLGSGVPILSTGSAALKKEALPQGSEVSNQYQIVQVWRDQIRIWARCFDAGRGRWMGDNRCTEDGDDWRRREKVDFGALDASFVPRADELAIAAAAAATQEPARPILGDLSEKADAHGLVQVRYQVQGATEQREMSGYRFRGRLVLTALPAASGGSPPVFEVGCLKHGGLVPAQSIWSGEALVLLEAASALDGDADACSPLCGWPDPAREIPCCVLWCGSGSEARQAQGVLHLGDGNEAAGRRHLTLSDVKAEPITGASVFCGGRLVGLVSTGPGPHGYTVELVKPLLREPAFATKIGWPPPSSVLEPLRREVTRILHSSELVRILAKQLKLAPTATVDAVATELLWTGAEDVLAMLCVAADQHKLSPDDPRPGPVMRLLELVLPYCFDWAAPVAEIERVQTKNARVVTLAASRKVLCELAMAGGTVCW